MEQQTETPTEEIKPAKTAENKTEIALSERRSLAPRNHKELLAVLENINEGKGFPSRFDTKQKRLAAYNLATSLMGERWQLALNNISEIKGQLSIFGEIPGAIAEQTREVAEKEVYCIDADYNKICLKNKNLNAKPWAAVCTIQRKGRSKKEFTYTIEEANTAGQYPATKAEYANNQRTGKQIPNMDSPWMKATKVMLMRKAMAMAIKFEFPDAMIGVPVAEYDYDKAPDLEGRDVTPSDSSLADELNGYAEKEAVAQ